MKKGRCRAVWAMLLAAVLLAGCGPAAPAGEKADSSVPPETETAEALRQVLSVHLGEDWTWEESGDGWTAAYTDGGGTPRELTVQPDEPLTAQLLRHLDETYSPEYEEAVESMLRLQGMETTVQAELIPLETEGKEAAAPFLRRLETENTSLRLDLIRKENVFLAYPLYMKLTLTREETPGEAAAREPAPGAAALAEAYLKGKTGGTVSVVLTVNGGAAETVRYLACGQEVEEDFFTEALDHSRALEEAAALTEENDACLRSYRPTGCRFVTYIDGVKTYGLTVGGRDVAVSMEMPDAYSGFAVCQETESGFLLLTKRLNLSQEPDGEDWRGSALLVSCDESGGLLWSYPFPEDGPCEPVLCAVDGMGNIYVVLRQSFPNAAHDQYTYQHKQMIFSSDGALLYENTEETGPWFCRQMFGAEEGVWLLRSQRQETGCRCRLSFMTSSGEEAWYWEDDTSYSIDCAAQDGTFWMLDTQIYEPLPETASRLYRFDMHSGLTGGEEHRGAAGVRAVEGADGFALYSEDAVTLYRPDGTGQGSLPSLRGMLRHIAYDGQEYTVYTARTGSTGYDSFVQSENHENDTRMLYRYDSSLQLQYYASDRAGLNSITVLSDDQALFPVPNHAGSWTDGYVIEGLEEYGSPVRVTTETVQDGEYEYTDLILLLEYRGYELKLHQYNQYAVLDADRDGHNEFLFFTSYGSGCVTLQAQCFDFDTSRYTLLCTYPYAPPQMSACFAETENGVSLYRMSVEETGSSAAEWMNTGEELLNITEWLRRHG